MGKIKVFTPGGLQTLLSKIVQIKVTADGSTSAATELGEELAMFTELVAEELRGKRDKAQFASCVLPATGWIRDGAGGYAYRLDVLAEGITDRDRVEVLLAPSSQGTAQKCALCPTCETLDGRIRFWAASLPTTDISAEYWIEKGSE